MIADTSVPSGAWTLVRTRVGVFFGTDCDAGLAVTARPMRLKSAVARMGDSVSRLAAEVLGPLVLLAALAPFAGLLAEPLAVCACRWPCLFGRTLAPRAPRCTSVCVAVSASARA